MAVSERTSGSETSATGAPDRPGRTLRSGSLGLLPVACMSLAYFSLASGIYFNFGVIEESANGAVAPLIFLIGTIGILPTALSFAQMTARRPSAGSVFAWSYEFLSPGIGLWTGWCLVAAYSCAAILFVGFFALFFNAFLAIIGVTATFWTGVGGGIAFTLIAAYLVYNDITISTKTIVAFFSIEVAFVLVLAAWVLIDRAGHLSLAPFDPGHAKAGGSGILSALIIAVLALAAVDSAAPVAEEAKTPKRLIPRATLMATLLAGGFWVFTSYAFSFAAPLHQVVADVNAGLLTPLEPIAGHYVGGAKILVPITGMTATFAGLTAALVYGSRLLFSLARSGNAPGVFAELHPRHKVPWNATIPLLLLSLFGLLIIGLFEHKSVGDATTWIGAGLVFLILIPYTLVNLVSLAYHARHRDEFNWFTTGLLPLIGVAVDIYLIVKGFFLTYSNGPFSSIVWVGTGVAVVGLIWGLYRGGRAGDAQPPTAGLVETAP